MTTAARAILETIAAIYTFAGIGALLLGFVIRWDDPLAPFYALPLGAPRTSLSSAVGGWSADSFLLDASALVAAISLDAALLWWWALTRQSSSERGTSRPA